jgi:hypothetical protein
MKSILLAPLALFPRGLAAFLLVHACTLGLAQVPVRVGLLPTTEIPESVAVDAQGNGYLSIVEGIRKITPAGVVSMFAAYPAGAPAGTRRATYMLRVVPAALSGNSPLWVNRRGL